MSPQPHGYGIDVDPEPGEGEKRLERDAGEEEITVVGAALRRAQGWREPFLGELVRQVGADRGGFGDDYVAVDEGGDLAHRVDRPVLGLFTSGGANDDLLMRGV